MNYKLAEILSYFIGLGALIGLFKIRKIDQTYYPFILLLWVGLLNEIINTIVINAGYSNAINDNIYGLLESLLITLVFYRMGVFDRYKNVFYYVLSGLLLLWIMINFVFFSIKQFSSYFNIIYSLYVVLLSINMINQLMLRERKRLIISPMFLVSIAFIFFFTYKALIEIFWVYGLNASKNFRVEVYRIMTYINLTVNIIYAIAVLWMPRKREFMLP